MMRLTSPIFWIAAAMALCLMGSTIISPLYSLYGRDWGLQPSELSLSYAVYMLGVLGALLVLGRLPDRHGYRRFLHLAVALAMAGALLTLLAPNLMVFMLGRAVAGVAASLVTAAAAPALAAHLAGPQRAQLSVWFNLLTALGFGLGPILGGLTAQFTPWPLVSAWVLMIALGLVILPGLGRYVPQTPLPAPAGGFRAAEFIPRIALPPRGARFLFVLSGFSSFLAFSYFSLFNTTVPLFLNEMLKLSGALVIGVSLTVFLALSALAQALMRRFGAFEILIVGLALMALGGGLLALSMALGSLTVFVLSVLLVAFGHGTSFLGHMTVVNRLATPANRAGLTSAAMVIGYLGAVLAVQFLGSLADARGAPVAALWFVALFGAMSAAVIAIHMIGRRRLGL